MERSANVWLACPAMMILFTALIAIGGRLTGVPSPTLALLTPAVPFALAWILWWPILRPKTGFWLHGATGIVCSLLALALQVTLSGR
jgi:hypothetical protein